MGLSISHELVRSLGGEIEIDSEPNHGTTVRLHLPWTRRTPSSETAAVSPPAVPPNDSARPRILIIDDEIDFVRAASRVLKGYDVVLAGSGVEGLEHCRSGDFDLVLCDLMMPETNGIDIYDTLARERPELLQRLVFMTGGTFTTRGREFLKKVGNRCLTKPFNYKEIHSLLEKKPNDRDD